MNDSRTLKAILNGTINKDLIVQESEKIKHITGFANGTGYNLTINYENGTVKQKKILDKDLHTWAHKSRYYPVILNVLFQQIKFDANRFEQMPKNVDFFTFPSGEKLYFL